ncbi:xin actin-binding repeat-containing protein 1-like [Parambassis ranga]|uniref:Xin actin-binding repeat-containing protein 1-like n=1 Tax=Parambassis ranga TaxID=210632 RepID=A0A6P7KP01_9TELE|nr:xin actin-binding repeat-containing protein 1-like [Parambassis ranga]
MSALYLSKVATQESKPEQEQSPGSGRGVKLTKMDSTSQQNRDDLPPPPSSKHHPGPEDLFGAHSQPPMPSHPSKEILYQQRQKCELRRLLKHTHPELKMLDSVVDEELAEVLSSEGVTAGETGYEGEVLSRRLIFESCGQSNRVSPYNPKMHMAVGTVDRCDFSKTSAVSAEKPPTGIIKDDKPLGFSPDLNAECEEEEIKIDVRATRRIFESQSMNICRPNPGSKFQVRASTPGDETKTVQKQCSARDSSVSREVSAGQTLCEDQFTSFPESDRVTEEIKTSAAMIQNNPFIPANIEREHTSKTQIQAGDTGVGEDCLTANVKNRTHLFESMPFDKIRHQNRDEIETMVENIKDTLSFLYQAGAIHSGGSIIEVNETMIAKKATFILSESGPEIRCDQVAEGGAQNFILQLLPRVNLKPQVTYLKEDSKGSMEVIVVDVPVHQHHLNTSKDTEFRTANVVQLIEDILNQDNSLRKGVIIQKDVNSCAKVIVYSLYNYFDEEDVKSYSPPQGSHMTAVTESAISSLLGTPQYQTCQGTIRPEITVRGNVKLFKSCIEKGDLEYLKTLQAESTDEEPPQNQTVTGQNAELHHQQRGDQAEESTQEWVPVDVKRLRSMFSGDQQQTQAKTNINGNPPQSTTVTHPLTGQTVHTTQGNTEGGQVKNTLQGAQEWDFKSVPQASHLHFQTYDDDRVHQAELVEVIDDNDEIANLQNAILSLQQATMEAKSLYHSSQEKQKTPNQEPPERTHVPVTAEEHKQPKISQGSELNSCTDPGKDELSSASRFSSGHTSDCQHKNIETCHEDIKSDKAQTTEKEEKCEEIQKQKTAVSPAQSSEITPAQQEEEEVVFQGKLQAALESLERSNINVSRGDFRAAMIYRNSSKHHQERLQTVPNPEIEFESVQEETAAKREPLLQSENKTSAESEKTKTPVRPKPAIPPKPEHLKAKQRNDQSSNTKNTNQRDSVSPKEPAPQDPKPLLKTSASCKDNSIAGLVLDSANHQGNKSLHEAVKVSEEAEVTPQVPSPPATIQNVSIDKTIIKEEENVSAEKKSSQDIAVKDNIDEASERHPDFHEACQIFGGKKATKIAPVKPKRVKIAQPDNKSAKPGDNDASDFAHMIPKPVQMLTDPSCYIRGQAPDSKDKPEKERKQESKVEMREKKGRTETEDERRQRLSVHMDEIMRGNINAAMEIFDNLRKQEELQSILSRVEEIEADTSEVDVRSLRSVFENVPDWVVGSDKKKQKRVQAENRDSPPPLKENTESSSSMAHVFGDLERASEEIMNLKVQTLARLMDIEEAIKKALYSVSTLKSDSDISGLSCLFKESLGAVQGSPSSGNISKISIGSSRTKSQQLQQSKATQKSTAKQARKDQSKEAVSAKQRASPPSSPAFISIQSAARKTDKTDEALPETPVCPACQQSPKVEEKFRTTKTLTCNSPAQKRRRDPRKGGQKHTACSSLNPNRELSVLAVQTDGEGNSIIGTKTVTENYERTDNFGNRFYSSKTSTVVTTQPETTKTPTSDVVFSPATHQVTTYPDIQLPVNQINTSMPK